MADFSKIKANLYHVLRTSGVNNFQYNQQILDLWDEIVGEIVAKNARPDRIVKGVLYIEVKNSSWINEISFLRVDIMDKYNETLKKDYIKDIKFFLKKADNETNQKRENYLKKKIKESGRDDLILAKKLPEEEKHDLAESVEMIEDERLKKSLQKFLEMSRKKQLALVEKGWKKCTKCNVLHKEKGSLCMLCESDK